MEVYHSYYILHVTLNKLLILWNLYYHFHFSNRLHHWLSQIKKSNSCVGYDAWKETFQPSLKQKRE